MSTYVNLSALAFHEFRIEMFCCATTGVLRVAIMIIITILQLLNRIIWPFSSLGKVFRKK